MIVLVGPEETPFGIQKDFLCSKSSFYRKYFDENPKEDMVENLVKLPHTPVEVFAFTQNYLYTGQVFPALDNLPSYEVLIGVWKLGHHLGIDGLCDATLEAMTEFRRLTAHIPATPLLVQVWKDTPEGSSIRKLLLSWAAEYMMSSKLRAEFAKSLPQEVLSELVIAMSSHDGSRADDAAAVLASGAAAGGSGQRRSAPQADLPDDADGRPAKKRRSSADPAPNGVSFAANTQATTGRKPGGPRVSLPTAKPGSKAGGPRRRTSAAALGSQQFSANQKLNFCADLLTRMLSGPGKQPLTVPPYFPKSNSLLSCLIILIIYNMIR